MSTRSTLCFWTFKAICTKHLTFNNSSLIPTSILVYSLKCWTCHPDANKNCFDLSNNVQLTCETENDSCATIIVDGSKFQS